MANLNIKLSKEQQQYLVLGILALGGGGYAYVKYFWMPTSKAIKETKEQLEKVNREIAEAKRAQGQLKQIQRALKELEAELKELTKNLPKQVDLPSVIDRINELALDNNLDVKSITPAGQGKKQGFTELYFTISAAVSWHDFGRFLATVALQERIYNIRDVNFGSTTEGKFSFTFKFIVYVYSGQ